MLSSFSPETAQVLSGYGFNFSVFLASAAKPAMGAASQNAPRQGQMRVVSRFIVFCRIRRTWHTRAGQYQKTRNRDGRRRRMIASGTPLCVNNGRSDFIKYYAG